jgi:hypothetical protein
MTDDEPTTMKPAFYLSRGNNQISSFELMKFIECLHLARGKLSGPEASLLHCLIMRGWTAGTFRVPQSILSLQTGLTTRTISKVARVFEVEGLIRRVQRRNKTTEYTLLRCEWSERAQFLFWNDETREKAIDEFVEKAWRHSRKQHTAVAPEDGIPQKGDEVQSSSDNADSPTPQPEDLWPPDPWTEEDLIAVDEDLQTQVKQAKAS